VEIDVALQGSTLKFNDIKVSNLGGARLAVRGSVADYDSTLPHPDIAFNFEAPDMSKVLKIVGGTAPPDLGLVKVSGGIEGTIEALNIKQLNVSAEGQTALVNGILTMPGASKGPPSTIGYKGSITANGQTIEGSVDAKVADRPSITADLKTSLLDVDKLGTGAPPPAAARGRPAAPASNAPIDTSALRAFDASVRLVAGTLVSSPLRISSADLALTLKDGVLTISHFKGGLYGGSLDLSGTVDGSKPGFMAIDFRGNASGIGLGEMLRSTSGSNQFGGSVKITIDGRLNASGITLKGAGATSQQLKGSMAGGAQLSGHIFVGADKALTMIGSAAAGAVSGVIDNTLGSALGIVGQRGGVGVSNLLNAASLVLNRFVNRDNPIAGHVDIAGGVLSDRSLIVQGDRATANIATRTNLAASTTDTTVNIMIAEDGSAPYLIATVRGPLSSPSYNVARGTAKDPPGFVNTLTTVPNQVISPVQKIIPNVPVPSIPIPNPIPGLFGR
jgi:AsmA-like protein